MRRLGVRSCVQHRLSTVCAVPVHTPAAWCCACLPARLQVVLQELRDAAASSQQSAATQQQPVLVRAGAPLLMLHACSAPFCMPPVSGCRMHCRRVASGQQAFASRLPLAGYLPTSWRLSMTRVNLLSLASTQVCNEVRG